jgi:eukaryotic-like serine/threonine-protein kinase
MVEELQATDPRSVGPYRLLGRLGAGGMGQVYLGRSAGGRLVAVKLIRPELAGEPGFRARFAREVAAARTVGGLFTALVVDADAEAAVPWLATAYVPGPSLAEAVDDHGPLPAGAVATLAAGLAEGLAAIHAAGVVHRDLKPSNVLLAADGPRVIDFGISRAAEASMLTQSGTVMGSPGFMSPEQAEGGPVGPASDVFSLGAVLAFAATGQSPFGTGPTPALVYRVVHNEPDTAGLPASIRPLVQRCLAKDPAARPATGDVLAELGSPGLAGGWLPGPLAGTLSGYEPPAGRIGDALTVTGAQAARTPAEAVRATTCPAPRGRRWHRAWLPAAAVLTAAAAVAALVIVPRADRGAAITQHPPAAGAARRHPLALGGGSAPPSPAAKQATPSARPGRPAKPPAGTVPGSVSAAPVGSAAGAAPATGSTASGPAPKPPAPKPPPPVPATAAVPDVLYTTLSAAASALKARGFGNIPYLYQCYGSSAIDDVVRQAPGAGAVIAKTAPVQLYLQADNCHTVPNVIGMNLTNAAYTLKQAGFSNIPYLYGCYGSPNIGGVVSQSPAPGTSDGSTQPVSLRLQASNC